MSPTSLYLLLFCVAGGGVAFVMTSRNLRAKRVALAIANAAFHSLVLLGIFSGAATTLKVSRSIVMIVILANAALVQWMVLYCSHCGGTYVALSRQMRRRCPSCGSLA